MGVVEELRRVMNKSIEIKKKTGKIEMILARFLSVPELGIKLHHIKIEALLRMEVLSFKI